MQHVHAWDGICARALSQDYFTLKVSLTCGTMIRKCAAEVPHCVQGIECQLISVINTSFILS